MFALCDGSNVWHQWFSDEHVSGCTGGISRQHVGSPRRERFGVCCRAGRLMVGGVSCSRRPLLPLARESAHMCFQNVVVMYWGDVSCGSLDRVHLAESLCFVNFLSTMTAMILRFAFR